MKSLSASLRGSLAAPAARRALQALPIAALLGLAALAGGPARAATSLADQPLFATPIVPGNLALLLSVEFPTAVSVAHTNRTYSAANTYLGYFDPGKCYVYRYTDGTSVENYFEPSGAASANVCTTDAAAKRWSGNFLNWATMQTIDPFRWALSGGYRVIDESTRTVTEKAWASGQGGTSNFPNSQITSAVIAGATPFPGTTAKMVMRVQGLGNKMRFTVPDTSSAVSLTGKYYNNTSLSGTPALTRTDASIDFNWDSAAPATAVNRTNMSVEWTGKVKASTIGSYVFRMRADDTVQLWVDGVLYINQTGYVSLANQVTAPIVVAAPKDLDIKVQFSQGGGGSSVVLEWLPPGATGFSVVGGGLASLEGAAGSATHYDPSAALVGGAVYEVFVRAKVCEPSAPESNCSAYGSNYKPEGLLQKYANKIRYSAFGYLNDSSILRDGGVLRAQQKFVGPNKPVPGSTAITNPGREWDASTGVFVQNPDKADADASALIFGTTENSGVINYLNKFGQITPGSYKTYDNVSELYYAAIRYFKNLPDVPEWSAVGAASPATKATWADGFPVVTTRADPILYSCQRNFVLGIGDVNTHSDKNLPGRLATQSVNEPLLPATVSGDSSVDAVAATSQVGTLEGLGSIGSSLTFSTSGGTNNSAGMAGLAFDSHINDIRPDDATKPNTAGKQTIDTYWVDVQEGQVYKNNNQFYLATKYGGFTVPLDYEKSPIALSESWWHTNVDTFGSNKRPDNYFSGGRPDLVIAGLDAAFTKIADSISAYTTSFSTALPQVTNSGNSSFSTQYDAKTWTGELTASSLAFDTTTSATTLVEKWKFTDKLAAQIAGTGWDTARRVLSWDGSTGVAFRATAATGGTKLAPTEIALLNTAYVTGDDSANYLNYLRGDRSKEIVAGTTDAARVYRTRAKLLGDLVGSRARPVGAPSFPLSDATNPGYGAFKTTWASRRTVVYVGSNDGMLHAINGALDTTASTATPLEADANAGKEMFAYVPRALFQGPTAPNTDGLASLGNKSFIHHYMVNATPTVRDVDFARVANAAKVKPTPAVTSFDWRSVLIGGLGKGGKVYYAIDVTDPVSIATAGDESTAATKVLWEFSNASMGFSYGDPLVVKTQKYGWVVVLTSGYNNADGQGYFFFVNPKTGALLEKVPTGAGGTGAGEDAGLANANAFILDATDGVADAIYAGDLLGNLWRLDITGTTDFTTASRLKKIATLTDAGGTAQPVTSRPAIEVHPVSKKRFVMVGTGRLLDTSDVASTQGQSFYAITDGTNAAFNATPLAPAATPAYPITRALLTENTNVFDVVSFDAATKVGWYEDLGVDVTTATPPRTGTGIAWRVTSDSTTLSGAIAFAATLPNGSVCSPSGDSRIYGRNYATAQSTVKDSAAGSLAAYVALAGNVTDLRYLSVEGRPVLLSGTDTGKLKSIDITPLDGQWLRRLNWRELQVVD